MYTELLRKCLLSVLQGVHLAFGESSVTDSSMSGVYQGPNLIQCLNNACQVRVNCITLRFCPYSANQASQLSRNLNIVFKVNMYCTCAVYEVLKNIWQLECLDIYKALLHVCITA